MSNIINHFQNHPVVTGLLSAGSSVTFSIIGVLSQENTVRLLGSIGAILGIILTILSICIAAKKLFKDGK